MPWDIDIGRVVNLGETIGSSYEREVVGLFDRSLQLIVRADWNPQPADDDGDKPQPKVTDSLTIRVEALPNGHPRIDNGENEGDDDPCYGCGCGNCPGVGFSEPFYEEFPPIAILRQDYEGCEQPVAGGYLQWGLLEVDENFGSVPAIGVIDGRETVVNPSSIYGRESEGERCEGGGTDSEGDWCMMVRKVG